MNAQTTLIKPVKSGFECLMPERVKHFLHPEFETYSPVYNEAAVCPKFCKKMFFNEIVILMTRPHFLATQTMLSN